MTCQLIDKIYSKYDILKIKICHSFGVHPQNPDKNLLSYLESILESEKYDIKSDIKYDNNTIKYDIFQNKYDKNMTSLLKYDIKYDKIFLKQEYYFYKRKFHPKCLQAAQQRQLQHTSKWGEYFVR